MKRKESCLDCRYIDEEPMKGSLLCISLVRAMNRYSSRSELPKNMRSEEPLFDFAPDANLVALMTSPKSDVKDFDKVNVFRIRFERAPGTLVTYARGCGLSCDSKQAACVVSGGDDS